MQLRHQVTLRNGDPAESFQPAVELPLAFYSSNGKLVKSNKSLILKVILKEIPDAASAVHRNNRLPRTVRASHVVAIDAAVYLHKPGGQEHQTFKDLLKAILHRMLALWPLCKHLFVCYDALAVPQKTFESAHRSANIERLFKGKELADLASYTIALESKPPSPHQWPGLVHFRPNRDKIWHMLVLLVPEVVEELGLEMSITTVGPTPPNGNAVNVLIPTSLAHLREAITSISYVLLGQCYNY